MITCLICNIPTTELGKVDLNKSCADTKTKKIFSRAKIKIGYVICEFCGLIFSPEMCSWPIEKFSKLIYNKDYYKVDPEYSKKRPENSAINFHKWFGHIPLAHLDYGGGDGLMSETLTLNGWNSTSWDPFKDKILPKNKFELISAIEVFEHHPNPIELILDINKYLSDNGAIVFTTAVSDGTKDLLNWWYLAPRNGHIVIYSRKALSILFEILKMEVHTIDDKNIYMAYKRKPSWVNAI